MINLQCPFKLKYSQFSTIKFGFRTPHNIPSKITPDNICFKRAGYNTLEKLTKKIKAESAFFRNKGTFFAYRRVKGNINFNQKI